MFPSLQRFCSTKTVRVTPFLTYAALGFAAAFWSPSRATAQTTTPSDPSEMRLATSAARMSDVYNSNGLTVYSILTAENGSGLWRSDNYAKVLDCWTTQSNLHSMFSANTYARVTNNTGNQVAILNSYYPYVNIFCSGIINAGGNHTAFSAIGLGEAFTSGQAEVPNGVTDYVEDNAYFFVHSVYQQGQYRDAAGSM